MFKKFFMGVCCVMAIFSFMGCSSFMRGTIDYSSVRAYIGENYYEEFDAKEYTLESLVLTNASDFSYRYYSRFDPEANDNIIERFFLINLSNKGKQYAQDALDQLIQLEFIDRVDFSYSSMYPGELLE
ncbi:MAG: hypothetical protein CVV59_00845 [Tenericutes bacterium HGW-Tenericutes-4]|nr:MAG: hypothetical protein CVV59_00845 [Tenericutes bacterium HGW-Tenericutes-4]